MIPGTSLPPDAASQQEEGIASVRAALARLKYGRVNLTVHEGRLEQIDATGRKRLKAN